MWGEFQLPLYIGGAIGGTVGSDFPYSSPDMGWGEGWGVPLEVALGPSSDGMLVQEQTESE